MREVKNMAQAMRETIAQLKAGHADATKKFQSEVANSHANLAKVKAFTGELAEANREVEQMLGETGSNFPTSDPRGGLDGPDSNGVFVPSEKKG